MDLRGPYAFYIYSFFREFSFVFLYICSVFVRDNAFAIVMCNIGMRKCMSNQHVGNENCLLI